VAGFPAAGSVPLVPVVTALAPSGAARGLASFGGLGVARRGRLTGFGRLGFTGRWRLAVLGRLGDAGRRGLAAGVGRPAAARLRIDREHLTPIQLGAVRVSGWVGPPEACMSAGALARLDHRRHAQVVAGRACLPNLVLDLLADVIDGLAADLLKRRDRDRGLGCSRLFVWAAGSGQPGRPWPSGRPGCLPLGSRARRAGCMALGGFSGCVGRLRLGVRPRRRARLGRGVLLALIGGTSTPGHHNDCENDHLSKQ
jgi:hypothetical protein